MAGRAQYGKAGRGDFKQAKWEISDKVFFGLVQVLPFWAGNRGHLMNSRIGKNRIRRIWIGRYDMVGCAPSPPSLNEIK